MSVAMEEKKTTSAHGLNECKTNNRGVHCGQRQAEAGGAWGLTSQQLHGSGGDGHRSGGVWHRVGAGERAAHVGYA
jgi:hypothetical protein